MKLYDVKVRAATEVDIFPKTIFEFTPPDPLPPSPLKENTVVMLLKLKAFLLLEPRRYDQNTWMQNRKRAAEIKLQKPPCGTVCCMAGEAVLMEGWLYNNRESGVRGSKDSKANFSVEDTATAILGLSEKQSTGLFSIYTFDYWCKEAHVMYGEAEDKLEDLRCAKVKITDALLLPLLQQRVQAAAIEIDFLIRTGRTK